jgi:hypothetical protein
MVGMVGQCVIDVRRFYGEPACRQAKSLGARHESRPRPARRRECGQRAARAAVDHPNARKGEREGGWLSTVRTTASGVHGTMSVHVGLVTIPDRVVGPFFGQFDWSVAENGLCRGGNGGGKLDSLCQTVLEGLFCSALPRMFM